MKLKVKNIIKKFKSTIAVNDISFEIKKNKTLGLLGPNGCGKTTSIGMMLGLITPTSGEILINDINFKPKNIGVHNKNETLLIEENDNKRVDKICNLIKLHIHVRMLMMCELMTIHIDYNWRRMLDDSKESNSINEDLTNSIFDHIRKNVCKTISINDTNYKTEQLLKIYNGNSECKIEIDQKKIDNIEQLLDSLHEYNEKIPELLIKSVSIAGDKFL